MKRALLLLVVVAGLSRADWRGGELTAVVGGRLDPDGKPIQIDLPGSMHLRNKGGRDGAGLCVFTSCDMAGLWAHITACIGLRDYMTAYPGGGWPAKVDQYLRKRCAELKIPVPRYIHVQKTDLEIVRRALATNRMICNTYYVSPTGRYGGGHIAHMTNTVHALGKWFGVLDNNYIGENAIEYMTEAEYTRTVGRDAWFIIFLDHGPPPPIPAASPSPSPMPKNGGKDGLS